MNSRIPFAFLLFMLLTSLSIHPVHAQTVNFSGQLRERSEIDTRKLVIGQSTDAIHYLRSRLRAGAALNTDVTVVFEVQDARLFGSKGTTLNTGSPAFDLRQGFVEVRNLLATPLSLKLGRQVISYGNERLLGGFDWNNFAQSFDGATLRVSGAETSLDLFGYGIARKENPAGGYLRDVFLAGAWAAWKPASVKSALNAFYLFDNPALLIPRGAAIDTSALRRHTAGVYANAAYGDFDIELEGAYQFGTRIPAQTAAARQDLQAYMIGARLGYTVEDWNNFRIGVGLDLLSGDDSSSTTYKAFHTLYGTNHKFYGYMDYFTDIPRHTNSEGLMDIMIQASIEPAARTRIAADFHLFSTVTDPKVFDPNTSSAKDIGMELDLTATWRVADVITMTGGYSVFDFNRDRPVYYGRKTTNWGFLMTTVNF